MTNDIFEFITDGASVMKEMGQEMGVIHQLCYYHGIYLAVFDILYKKKSLAVETTQEELINDENNKNEEADSDPDDDNDNEECWNEESNCSVD